MNDEALLGVELVAVEHAPADKPSTPDRDDWRLHKVYRDTESGTHMNRPGLEEMLFDAEGQVIDTALTSC